MISLQPRETKANDLPEPVRTVVLINESMARLDVSAEADEGTLVITIAGIYLGAPVAAPFDGAKPKWKLE